MSRSDFDVVTGPSMPQRQAPEPRQSVRSAALSTKSPTVVTSIHLAFMLSSCRPLAPNAR